MKKIFYILVSAIVALGAVACNNEIDENIEANNGGVVSFTVSLDDEASRITIGDRVDGKHPITFNQGDVIYATNSSLKAFEFVCEADNATFVCTNPNADGKLPTEMVGETLDFYTNKTPNSDTGAEGIVLRANDTLDNTEGEVITLTLGSPVLAYTAPQEVTLKADKRIFRTGGSYEFEMTVPAAEEKNYVAILGNQGKVNFSYAIAGETVKEMPEFTFENLIYDLGNLTTAVAEVNGKKFTELSKAIAAVEDGGTITLAADYAVTNENRVELNGYYEGLFYQGDKSFTLDLGGYKFTNESNAVNDYMILFNNSGEKASEITIKNGTIDAGTAAYCAVCTATSSTQKITLNLENVELINNNPGGAVIKVRGVAEGTELNVKAGTKITAKDSYVGIEAVSIKTVVNIYDGAEINQNGTSSYVGSLVGVSCGATANVYGGKGVSAKGGFIAMTSGGTINIEGGEWTANTDGTPLYDNYAVLLAQNDTTHPQYVGTSIVNVKGGTFKGGYNCYANVAGNSEINIYDGLFNADPTAYIADPNTLKAVLDDATQLYDVVERVPVARIEGDDTVYETVGAAFKAAKDGDVITILEGEFSDVGSALGDKSVTVKGTLGDNGERLSTLDMTGFAYAMNFGSYKATINFEDLNIKHNNTNYKGFLNAEEHYKNCAIEGTLWIYSAKSSFTDCVFTNTVNDVYSIWHYGSAEANYLDIKGCTFNATGKAVLAYSESARAHHINIENTTFNSSVTDAGKTAVQMHTELGTYGTLTIDDQTTANGFGNINGGMWNDLNNGSKTPTDKFLKKIAGVYYIGDNAEHAKAALRSTDEEINVKVYMDATIDVAAWNQPYYLGGTDTKNIYVEGYVYNLANADQTPSLTFDQKGGDWNYVRLNNDNGVLNLKNIAITSSGQNKGDYSRSLLRFYNKVNLENVNSGKGLSVYNDANLTNVTISDTTGTEDNYSLWIVPNKVEDGLVKVNVENCQLINKEGTGDRGIVVNDNYLNEDEVGPVELNVKGTTFKTNKKAAVLYKVNTTSDSSTLSPYKLTVNWENNNIDEVAADNENAVWVDEDSGAYFDWVTVNGCTKLAENAKATVNGVYYSSTEEAIKAAAEEGTPTTVNLIAGEYTSFPTVALAKAGANVTLDANGSTFTGTVSLNVNGATVQNANFVNESGSVLSGTMDGNFKGCSFTGYNAARYTYAPEEGKTVYFTECVFDGAVYGFHVDDGAGSIYFKECEFYGFNAFGGALALVTFDNCLFGHKEGGAGYNGANLWGNTVMMNGTRFDWSADGVQEWIQPKSSGISYEFTGVVIDNGNGDEAMTYKNIETLTGNVFPEVIIDGVTYEGVADDIVLEAGEYYLLDRKEDMFWFANEVNGNGNDFKGKTVKLIAEVDLDNAEWTPIQQFAGTFDGGENAIKNLNVEDYSSKPGHAVGLFGATNYATIQNVTIEGAKVGGLHFVATVVGYLHGGSITNCKVSGAQIVADPSLPDDNDDYNGDKVGGIVGYNDEGYTISDCEVSNTTITAYRDMGGIVGCSVAGNISGNKVSGVTFNINNSYNYKNYEQQKQYNVNAILGRDNGGGVSLGTNDVENVTYNWGDIPAALVAEVNGVKYPTLAAALAAANGGTVTLLDNCEGTITISQVCTIEAGVYNINIVAGNDYRVVQEGTTYKVELKPAVLRINNMNGWGDLNVTIKSGENTLVNAQAMTNGGDNIFYYELDAQYIGTEITYYITHSWYQTSTKTVTVTADTDPIVLNTTYLQPNSDGTYWGQADAWFVAYMWNGSTNVTVKATAVKDNFYEVEIPTNVDYTNIIWVRKNPTNSSLDFDGAWNQTSDLTLKHNCYCVNSWDKIKLNDSRWY